MEPVARSARLIFVPFLYIFLSIGKNAAAGAGAVGISLLYAVVFMPMFFFVDRMAYRAYQRRLGGRASVVGVEVALAGPRREQQEDPRARRPSRSNGARPASNHARKPGPASTRLAAALDPHAPLEHDDPRALVHLVVAERLPGIEADQHRARLVLRVDDDRRAAAARRVDLASGSSSARRGV